MAELQENRRNEFRRSRLVLIDNDDTNIVYSFLTKPRKFAVEKILNYQRSIEQAEFFNEKLVEKIDDIQVVSSVKAGLGKTHYIEQLARQRGK